MRKDQEEEFEKIFQQYQKKMQEKTKKPDEEHKIVQSRKKEPQNQNQIQQSSNFDIDVEERKKSKFKFQDLPEQVTFYLIEIYPFSGKLFLTGLMENGQTLSIVANDLYRQLYFVLRRERIDVNQLSEDFLKKAEGEVKYRLKNCGLNENDFTCEFQEKEYVFEIEGIPREKRPYLKVRYSFKHNLKEEPEPDWEGETFKYIFGTTYTPLQLLIINKKLKGPCWVTIPKHRLKENYSSVDQGLCVDIGFSELLEVDTGKMDPPPVRALSFSLKAVIPSTVSTKKYFPTERKDETHIYAISYHLCQNYSVSVKDAKPKLKHKTYYLKEFGDHSNGEFVKCDSEVVMLSRFEADLKFYDPDFIICHDSSKVLDTLICRILRLGTKNKTKIGRLNLFKDPSKTNQVQRINSFIAGRLLVDTFIHAKQMIKSIDYELESMAKHIKPEKNFVGISDEEAKVLLGESKPLPIINKCKEESELTFNLMNHLQILQMTRQVSNICGNLWKRSLQNKRAERNQFFIMHNCKDRDLIIPDKFRKNDDEEVEIKKKYQGGMVLEPEKGFYSDYILLLDFNSLYPSIIREYNVCFSIIDRPKLPLDFYYRSKAKKKQKQNEPAVDVNREDEDIEEMFSRVKSCNDRRDWGFLPKLIDEVVQRRKRCKATMKKVKNPVDRVILDIQQKCYKLVANSIYGCLGFSVSRFYSRPLAALITKKGRDSLIAAKDIVSKRGGVRVIYGDTDSLMIEPNLNSEDKIGEGEKLKNLKSIADELKEDINKMYTFLEIDIDGIFKPLILLMKKKYVANKLINFDQIIIGSSKEPKFSLEFKGIQIVRRDGCKIARDTLENVIQILVKSGQLDLDRRYEQIRNHFQKLKETLEKKPKQDFLFSKQLSKKPKEYVNGESLPHVKVALDRLNNGQREESLVNHTIYYLICKGRDEHDSLAKCAFDIKSYERSRKYTPEKALEIDFDYYKSVIMEPIGRLLSHINSHLFDELIDIFGVSKKRQKALKDRIVDEVDQGETFGEALSQNFKSKARQLNHELGEFICPKCEIKCNLVDSEKNYSFNLHCQSCKENPFSLVNVIYNKIWLRIKQDSYKYYNNRKVCKCTKHYDLTPITPCCQIDKKYKGKGDIIFKLHNFLYICKDMCEYTQQKLQKEKSKGLEQISRMIENFLQEESKYEDVSDIFSKLQL